jgi:hypothetical protein
VNHAQALAILVLAPDPWPTAEQVRAAFRARAKATHPDQAKDKAAAHAAFIRLKEAYDLALAEAAKPPPAPPGAGALPTSEGPWSDFGLMFTLDDFQDHYNRLRRPKKPRAPKPRIQDARQRRRDPRPQGP